MHGTQKTITRLKMLELLGGVKEMVEIIASIGFIVVVYLFVVGMMVMWDKEK